MTDKSGAAEEVLRAYASFPDGQDDDRRAMARELIRLRAEIAENESMWTKRWDAAAENDRLRAELAAMKLAVTEALAAVNEQDGMLAEYQRVRAELDAAREAQRDMVLVPREPTSKMIEVGAMEAVGDSFRIHDERQVERIWTEMLSAAPSVSKSAAQQAANFFGDPDIAIQIGRKNPVKAAAFFGALAKRLRTEDRQRRQLERFILSLDGIGGNGSRILIEQTRIRNRRAKP